MDESQREEQARYKAEVEIVVLEEMEYLRVEGERIRAEMEAKLRGGKKRRKNSSGLREHFATVPMVVFALLTLSISPPPPQCIVVPPFFSPLRIVHDSFNVKLLKRSAHKITE